MTATQNRRSTLRLTLAGFNEKEANDIATMVRAIASSDAPWMVVNLPPYDAALLGCGTREGDAANNAVLRVANEMVGAHGFVHRQSPLLLPRPLQERTLKLALEAAIVRLQAQGADPRT